MLFRQISILLVVSIVGLVIVTACAPVAGGPENGPAQAQETASDQSQGEGGGQVVDVTPMSEADLTAQPPGGSDPGAGPTNEGSEEPQGQEKLTVYTDSTYKFSVSYPSDFVFRTQPAEKLSALKPMPSASFVILNPVTAASDLGDQEPADLEIRVYQAGQIPSLDSWLMSNELLPADNSVPVKPFQSAHVSGVEICSSTMIAPGCSYFVLGKDAIYQLTPATLEGENLIETFMLQS